MMHIARLEARIARMHAEASHLQRLPPVTQAERDAVAAHGAYLRALERALAASEAVCAISARFADAAELAAQEEALLRDMLADATVPYSEAGAARLRWEAAATALKRMHAREVEPALRALEAAGAAADYAQCMLTSQSHQAPRLFKSFAVI